MSHPKRILPVPTPETQYFWDGCRAQQLLLQRCRGCDTAYFPPRPICPHCADRSADIFAASGKGTLHSYVINHRPRPDMGSDPYAIAIVKLAEGPAMMSNIVDCPQTPEALVLDMPLEVVFSVQSDTITLPFFKPAGA